MIIANKYIVPKGFEGITLFPFIILKEKELKRDEILINHEKIHLQQQKELGVVFFFIFYGLEYVYRLFQFKNHFDAYQNISFEREAFHQEKNTSYLMFRKKWQFIKYL